MALASYTIKSTSDIPSPVIEFVPKLCLDKLVPPSPVSCFAATCIGPSSGNSSLARPNDAWKDFSSGVASMTEDWEWVSISEEVETDEVMVKVGEVEKEKDLEKEGELVTEKEQEKEGEQKMEKDQEMDGEQVKEKEKDRGWETEKEKEKAAAWLARLDEFDEILGPAFWNLPFNVQMLHVREAERLEILKGQRVLAMTDTPEQKELRELNELAQLKDLVASGMRKVKVWKDKMHALMRQHVQGQRRHVSRASGRGYGRRAIAAHDESLQKLLQ